MKKLRIEFLMENNKNLVISREGGGFEKNRFPK